MQVARFLKGSGHLLFLGGINLKRAACLIDAGYLNNGLKQFNNFKVDYKKLVEQMCDKDILLRTYYYCCKCYMSPSPTEDERKRQASQDTFLKSINSISQFECRYGRLERRYDADTHNVFFEQKRVDVLFATDLVNLSSKRLITHVCLITGDSDMLPAIQIAKNEGVIVTLFYFPDKSTHHELLEEVDIAIPITDRFLKIIEYSKS